MNLNLLIILSMIMDWNHCSFMVYTTNTRHDHVMFTKVYFFGSHHDRTMIIVNVVTCRENKVPSYEIITQ